MIYGCPGSAPDASPLPKTDGVKFHRYHFVPKSSRSTRRRRALLRTQRILVLFVTTDLVLAGELLSRLAHHQTRERIVKAIAIHTVHEIDVAHARAPTPAFRKVRNPRHAFRAAGEHN